MKAPACKFCGEPRWSGDVHVCKSLPPLRATDAEPKPRLAVAIQHPANPVGSERDLCGASEPALADAGDTGIAGGERPAGSKFDRNAYQREYMRKRREAAKKDKTGIMAQTVEAVSPCRGHLMRGDRSG